MSHFEMVNGEMAMVRDVAAVQNQAMSNAASHAEMQGLIDRNSTLSAELTEAKEKMAEAETKFAEMQGLLDKQAAQIEKLKNKS